MSGTSPWPEAEIPDCCEEFREKERVAAFDELVKAEQLDAEKQKQVIDRYIYTGQEPLKSRGVWCRVFLRRR